MAVSIKIDIERMLAHLGSIKIAYSVDELAEVTPLSRFYWYSVINSGQLPAVKANDKTIVLLWDLIAFFDQLPSFEADPKKTERSQRASKLRHHRQRASHSKSLNAETGATVDV